MDRQTIRPLVWWIVLVTGAVLLWQAMTVRTAGPAEADVPLSEFVSRVNDAKVNGMVVEGNVFHGTQKDQIKFQTVVPSNYPDIYKLLFAKGVSVVIKEPQETSWLGIFVNALPIIIMIALWVYMMRALPRSRRGGWGWPAKDPLSELQSARDAVEERVPDLEGHRTQALQAIDRALEEVRRAMVRQ
jgi:cell division protease FtsH